MVLDALTLNPDRHCGNFGVLYDADTLKILRMAPVFDNNLSFVPYTETDNLDKADILIRKAKAFLGYNPNEMAIKCLTPGIASQLKALKGFTFSENTKSQWALHNNDHKRLGLLEQLVDRQIDNILERRIIITKLLTEPLLTIQAIHISIDKKVLADLSNVIVSRDNIEIGDFDIIFESGQKATIRVSDFDVNDIEDGCDIDIFASHFINDVKK
ncbi:MAG: hypothetical protein K6G15_12180 [Desulfovibrio sp.]|nr:hypothetical protein [Desulfovibrio sp.]